ncbi:MAG: TatD family hydrolase [Polaribacter sp.]|uniref:TatD family hydrolase n=1 Tax=Polaribacter sp. TaxID=1920175 RepID=UPI002F35A184
MQYFDVHTHKNCANENVFSIENKYPNSTNFSNTFSIGIHPWFINKKSLENEFLIVENQLQNKNCFAIGECGLDKLTETNFELQKEVFIKQIKLSEKYKKPLIVHCVKSYQEIIEIKKELKPNQTWVLHGFNKNLQVAESLLKNGILMSIGAAIINNKKLQEVVSKLELSTILIETDDSEIDTQEVYQKIAVIKSIEVVELQQIIKQNFTNIFEL